MKTLLVLLVLVGSLVGESVFAQWRPCCMCGTSGTRCQVCECVKGEPQAPSDQNKTVDDDGCVKRD